MFLSETTRPMLVQKKFASNILNLFWKVKSIWLSCFSERRQRVPTRFFGDEVPTPHSPPRRRRTRPDKMSYVSPARKRGPINR